nr:cobyrinate a,c-diamide synthase [Mediterraneibacter glycyrrhizinilyticus]
MADRGKYRGRNKKESCPKFSENPSGEPGRRTPGILLAAPASGSGKTAAACALMAALQGKGMNVRACKCGPDYIDPMFHREVLGVDSKNLDLFFSDKEELIRGYQRHTEGADIAVVEGVMGYYDGMALDTEKASSYDVARTLGLPVLLVLPARGAALSLAAVVKGMSEFREDSNIQGILLNRVSDMLYPRLKEMLERKLHSMNLDIPVVGYLPEDPCFCMESRHLGLVTPQEMEGLKDQIQKTGELLSRTVDLELVRRTAGEAAAVAGESSLKNEGGTLSGSGLRIGIARDEAFCFYYKDNLNLLEDLGCTLIPFSPLRDRMIPEDLDGLLLGGGYPELHGKELAENRDMLSSVRTALQDGMPCLAECGGFMYLHEEMEDREGNVYPLVGQIRGKAFPTGRLVRFGYVNLEVQGGSGDGISDAVGPQSDAVEEGYLLPGESIRGHEFHYWDSTDSGADCVAVKPDGRRKWNCIHMKGNLFAGYPHLYLPSMKAFAERFVARCASRKEEKMRQK